MALLYFEDLLEQASFEAGSYEVTQEAIIAFAQQFDPQAIHIDPKRAVDGQFGGLIASGMHTSSILMRLACDAYILGSAALGSPGLDELRYLAPVRPGDSLRGEFKILKSSISRSKPDRGSILMAWSLYNQTGAAVATAQVWGIHWRKPQSQVAMVH